MIRRLFVFSILALFAPSILGASVSPSSPEETPLSAESSCQKKLDLKREKLLEETRNLERSFSNMTWKARKTWEILYQAVWTAEQKTKDPFSTQVQTEGEIESERYRFMAENEWSEMMEESASIKTTMTHLESLSRETASCCDAWAYQNCQAYWAESLHSLLKDLGETLDKFLIFLNSTRQKMIQSLEESPSDHTPYGNRTVDLFQTWHTKWEPGFLQLLRLVNEQVETELGGNNCCNECSPANLKLTASRKDNPLGPPPEYHLGVEGGVIPKQTIGRAIEKLEKPKEVKKDLKDMKTKNSR